MFFKIHQSLVLGCALVLAQTPAPSSSVATLDRPVGLSDLKGTSADAAASLLLEAQVPGGVISKYDDCAQPTELVFSLPAGTKLVDGLNYVSGLDNSRQWAYRDGVVVVGSKLTGPTLLNTILGQVRTEAMGSLTLSTQQLLESAAVRRQIKKTGLIQMNTPIGFSAVSKSEVSSGSSALERPHFDFQGKSLEQALNILAVSNGRGVWHYEQFECGQKTSFRIGWLVH